MKKFSIIVMTILTLGFTACSDDDDNISINNIPEAVITEFNTQFPNASDIEYEIYGDQYLVDFEINTIDYEALFDSNGTLVKYKYDILNTEIPQDILTAIANDYDNRPIDDAEILVIDEQNYYQIELDNTPLDDYIVFNADGSTNTSIVFWD